MRKLLVLIVVFTASLCLGKTEIGQLQGVPFRIDVPENWNHGLVVYYHGYRTEPEKFKDEPLNPALAEFTKRGYAVVQSAYSRTGWAVQQAIPETEALRRYFVQKYGAPKETFVTGHSMGGFLTAETMERFPERYAAGLDLCGAVESAPSLIKRAFDFEVVFDYYFPGLLPAPNNVPASFNPNDETIKKIGQQLHDHPEKAAALRQFSRLKKDEEVAGNAAFLAFVLKDAQQRSGGNPFSNRDMIYSGSPDDNRLNDGVKRYDANASLAYLKANYTLTGKLQHPMLAIHTSYDPLVPVDVPDGYAMLTKVNGSGTFFVLQYVEHDGHCNISSAEIGKGFDELLAWTHEPPVQPLGGHLAVRVASSTK
jgi:pimeloyl-ACP methyl ester carboxylesterase